MELDESEVRNLQRRGQRLRAKGYTDEEIVANGALPIVRGGRWTVSPSLLARHELVAGRALALHILADLVEGKAQAPRSHVGVRPSLLEAL